MLKLSVTTTIMSAALALSGSIAQANTTKTLCAEFSLFPSGSTMSDSFDLSAFHFQNAGPPWMVHGDPGKELGLRFSDKGGKVTLPTTTGKVSVRIGTFAGPVTIELVNEAGGSLSNTPVPVTNDFQDLDLAGQGIAGLILSGGNNEGVIGRVCVNVEISSS